jgi:hypothetical protein
MNWTKDDVITSDKYLAVFPNSYYKMDAIYYNHPISWRNRWHSPPLPSARLIVSGHSDFPVTEDIVRRYPFAKWFGINKQTHLCKGLPLGITNDTDESDLHRIYGNVDSMVDVASQPRNIKNLVYMNFSIGTYPTQRQKVWDMFKDKSWVTCEQPINSMEGRKTFLSSARNHSYVLCPRGNGIDTHRLWETLYMGSIPIVLSDIAHSDWTDLPILFVNSWEEVTEEFLKSQLERFTTTQWNYNKLHIGYWIRQIQG